MPVNLLIDSATAVDLGALTDVEGFLNIIAPVATAIDLSVLETVGSGENGGGLLADFTAFTGTVDLGALQTVGAPGQGGDLSIAGAITGLDLSALLSVEGSVDFVDTPSLATATINAGLLSIGGDVLFTNAALDQTSVDLILVCLAALDGTGGTTSYDGHVVNLSGGTNATPSATGTAAIVTLSGRGNFVFSN